MFKRVIIFTVIFSLLFSGCATKELWSKESYKESVETFLMSHDKKQLIVIGKKYHYIFALDDKLKDILESKKRKKLKVLFQDFQLTSNENIKGKYILYYHTNKKILQKDEDYKWFKTKGFEESNDNSMFEDKLKYVLIGELNGTRYNTNGVVMNSSQKFNQPYCVRIYENYYKYDEDTRLKNTPVTVTVDGIATIAVTALLVFALRGGGSSIGGGGDSQYDDLEKVNRQINCNQSDKVPSTFFVVF